MKSWIGKITASRLVGLFDATQSIAAPDSMTEGSIVRISETIEVIAAPGSAHATVLEILARFGLNPEHPEAGEQQAAELLQDSGIDAADLTDLSALDFITIDNEGSRDLDQALCITTMPDGYRVYYALADASWYVQPGTPLFREALKRGATYYAPTIAAPMLPRSLSENLVSLNPNVERRALVFDMQLTANGSIEQTRLLRARIRSRAQLTYNGVQDYLDACAQGVDHPYQQQSYRTVLQLLQTVGELRINLARERKVVEYMRREPQVRPCKDHPGGFNIEMRERNDVERYNEQISLLCNIEGARLLEQYAHISPELQTVYRVHTPPLSERMNLLRAQLDELVNTRQLPDIWRWRQDQDLASYMKNLPTDAYNKRCRQAVERQILLSNNASEFSAEAGPHHALGVDAYARFSSPMREIVGIFTHKELLEALSLQMPHDIALDEALRSEVIATANQAKYTQKMLDKEFQLLVIDGFLHADLTVPLAQRPRREATVMGMRGTRIYLSVDGFALDLKVYASDLEKRWNCRYQVSSTAATPSDSAAPEFKVGDGVGVVTRAWEKNRRRFLLDITPLH